MLKKLYGVSGEGEKRVRKGVAFSVVLNFVIMLSTGMFVSILHHTISAYTKGQSGEPLSLLIYTIASVVFTVIIFYLQKYKYFATYAATYEESANTRISLAEKIRELPMSFLTRVDVSELSYTMMSDVTTIEHAISHAVIESVALLVTVAIAFVLLLFFNYKLAVVLFIFLPVGMLIIYLTRKWQNKKSNESAIAKILLADKLQEVLENIQVIKANHLVENFNGQIKNLGDEVVRLSKNVEMVVGSLVMSILVIVRLGALGVVVYGGSLLAKGEVDVITYVIFVFIATRIFEPLTGVFMMAAEMIHAITSNKRIQNIENQKTLTGEKNVSFANYNIELKDIHFAYNDEKVINGISAQIPAGKVTALVGPSGSGKSTLSKLIARFWDTQSGLITIGRKDISKIDSDELLKSFSVVFQNVVLFNDSIYNNIAIGRKSATREEVLKAAKDAQCMDFIDKLPNGFDTEIGENGYTLSGGERQRLSVARAFLKDAPIVLLDEATASVDPENETLIQEAFGRLIKDKTVIIIAHRLRTIQDVDQILVLDRGEIVEGGSHEELMKNAGLYSHMYTLQHKSDQWTVEKNKS